MSGAENWVRVAAASDVSEGQMIPVEVNGLSLAVYNAEGEYYCTDNICTHAFALLTDGFLEGTTIECPLHAGQFDICTGKGLGAPIEEDIKTFAVKVEGDDLLVNLPT